MEKTQKQTQPKLDEISPDELAQVAGGGTLDSTDSGCSSNGQACNEVMGIRG